MIDFLRVFVRISKRERTRYLLRKIFELADALAEFEDADVERILAQAGNVLNWEKLAPR